jgi:hypothetical protein
MTQRLHNVFGGEPAPACATAFRSPEDHCFMGIFHGHAKTCAASKAEALSASPGPRER